MRCLVDLSRWCYCLSFHPILEAFTCLGFAFRTREAASVLGTSRTLSLSQLRHSGQARSPASQSRLAIFNQPNTSATTMPFKKKERSPSSTALPSMEAAQPEGPQLSEKEHDAANKVLSAIYDYRTQDGFDPSKLFHRKVNKRVIPE